MKKLFFALPIFSCLFALPTHAAPSDWRNSKTDALFADEFSPETIFKKRKILISSPETDRAIEASKIIGEALENDREKTLDAATLICDARASYTSSYMLILQTTREIRNRYPQTHPLTARYVAMQFVNRGMRAYCPSLVDN